MIRRGCKCVVKGEEVKSIISVGILGFFENLEAFYRAVWVLELGEVMVVGDVRENN
jgi:hypothetical protein